jgi:hypothetical protein
MKQVESLIGNQVSEVYVDMGYRGHDYDGPVAVHVDKRRRGRTSAPRWRWMKRRAAVEPSIGHLKSEHRLERNRLKGTAGKRDQRNPGSRRDELPKAPQSFLAHFSVLPDRSTERLACLESPEGRQHSTSICLKITFSGSTNYLSASPI